MMGAASKKVHIWVRMVVPDTRDPVGPPIENYQPLEIPNVPVRGRLVRLRMQAAGAGNNLDWYLADTPFSVNEVSPSGGVMSIITQEPTPVSTRGLDMIGDHMKGANGATVSTSGIPFHLTETGPPGSGVGSLFLSFQLTVRDEDLNLVLVIEPLVT
jgi:hypothetical protein